MPFGAIETWAHGPFRFLLRFSEQGLRKYWADYVAEVGASSGVEILSGRDHDRIALVPLQWESKFFAKRMGAIEFLLTRPEINQRRESAFSLIDRAIKIARAKSWNFLSAKVYADDVGMIHALERNNFRLVDTVLDYVADENAIAGTAIPDCDCEVREARDEDSKPVEALYRRAFAHHFGRFHSDPGFTSTQANEFYASWVNSSFSGYADRIIVAERGAVICGASFWKNETTLQQRHKLRLGHYSIGAVDPGFSSGGVFTAITAAGMREFKDVAFILGPTHVNNYGVQRGYAKLGWKIFDARHSFHLWLK